MGRAERQRERERKGVVEVQATGLKGGIGGVKDPTGMAQVTLAYRWSIKSADSGVYK